MIIVCIVTNQGLPNKIKLDKVGLAMCFLMMERRKEKLCDCILGMFYLSLKTGKTYSSAPQIYQTLFDGTKKKYSPKPAGLYLFNKSMSFILIKSILVQMLRLLTFSFIRKGQRKIKDLDRESSTTGLCPIDAVTVVGKRTSSLRVQSAKREGIFFYCYLLISSQ